VGTTATASGNEAFRWTQAGGIVGLGDLSGDTFYSEATGVSPDGSVVIGESDSDAAVGYEAFRWTPNGGMVGLGILPDSTSSWAYDVSTGGSIIVGTSGGASGTEAFLWDVAHGMRSLRDVLAKDFGLGASLAGWTLEYARGISADGQFIVGSGTNPDGNTEAWLARIELEPMLPGDYNSNGSVDAADYVVWRTGLESTYTQNDYNVWRAHFGLTAGSGAAEYPLGASAASDSAPGEAGFRVPAAVVPEPRAAILLVIGVLATVVRRMRRVAAIAALSPLVPSLTTAARATTFEFVYRGSFEYAYPETGSPFEDVAAGTPWTARVVFDDAAENQYPPDASDPSIEVYQGISVDLTIGDWSADFDPVWIGVADNCCEWVRGGYFYDGIDVTAGSSAEVYLGLYDPTLAAIHSTALPAQINLADWSNRDIVLSVGGYFTGPISDINSHIVPEPPAALLLLSAAFALLLRLRSPQRWTYLPATELVIARPFPCLAELNSPRDSILTRAPQRNGDDRFRRWPCACDISAET
jgi:probable HAF family extracellular repeat protein